MSEQTSFIKEKIQTINPKLYYITWHIDMGKGEVRKSYSPGYDSPLRALNIAMRDEVNTAEYPKVVQTGVGVLDWLSKTTEPEPLMRSNMTIEIFPEIGAEVNFLGEGTFKVKLVDEYKDGLCSYPWLLLTSMSNDYDIIMSLRALNHKILRKKSPHKNLNFTLLDSTDNQPAYWFTVGHLLNTASLHLRTTTKVDSEVMRKYKQTTGSEITGDLYERFVYRNENEDTFTHNADIRIPVSPIRTQLYFPKNRVGKREGVITKVSGEKIELIQNTDYVWTLFHYGFRIGARHNKDKVIEHVKIHASEFIEDFMKGYNYGKA